MPTEEDDAELHAPLRAWLPRASRTAPVCAQQLLRGEVVAAGRDAEGVAHRSHATTVPGRPDYAAEHEKPRYTQSLAVLLAQEVDAVEQRRLQRRLQCAKLPARKSDAQPSLFALMPTHLGAPISAPIGMAVPAIATSPDPDAVLVVCAGLPTAPLMATRNGWRASS